MAGFEVKGWCPGALRPMQSGDGLIVRVRPQAGAFPTGALKDIAAAARSFGNGQIDLTRRANLQIRGVSEATFEPLLKVLARLGLLDASAAAEAARNLLVSPLSGIDPAEVLDMRPATRALAQHLAGHAETCALSGKFGFVLDGGGSLSLADERADIRLLAMRGDQGRAVLIGLDGAGRTDWLGAVEPERAADAALRLADAFRAHGGSQRARDLPPAARAALKAAMTGMIRPHAVTAGPHPAPPPERLGVIDLADGRCAAAFALAFGRIEAGELLALADAAEDAGAAELRLSPWRSLYAPTPRRAGAAALCARARDIGLITEAGHPLRRVDACPGAPSCNAARAETRNTARRLSQRLADAGFCGRLHVSGCAKGCARSAPADLTVVGEAGGYAIIRDGTARDAPFARLDAAGIDSVLDIAAKIGSNRRYD